MIRCAAPGALGLVAASAACILASPRALAAPEASGERTLRARIIEVRVVDFTGSTKVALEVETEGEELAAKPFIDIFVGAAEGMAIARALEGVKTRRPMTHDLFAAALDELGARVERLTVTKLEKQTFLGELAVRVAGGGIVKLDCRPSDGMAMALGALAPVFVAEDVLRLAGRAEDQAAPGTEEHPGAVEIEDEGRDY